MSPAGITETLCMEPVWFSSTDFFLLISLYDIMRYAFLEKINKLALAFPVILDASQEDKLSL